MTSDYASIAAENVGKYGTDIERYGRVLLAHLYSDRTHFIYELLQNAEDARATTVTFRLFGDRLELIHNGRPFDEPDVKGICGLVEGTGTDDLTRIGKFGIGFKSVYAYTSSPEVHSGDEHFRVEHYVRPRAAEPRTVDGEQTLFVFPFDQDNASKEEAFSQIARRLRALGSRILLFLRHIDTICWEIEGGQKGTYLRDTHVHGAGRRVTVIGEGEDGEEEEAWLVFERPVTLGADEPRKVEAAFLLERDEEGNDERIVPVDRSDLVVFFPTEKETHLGFLIQGPYRTTPPRDNVPKDAPWNQEILQATATLVAEALPQIRDMGLLTVSCLESLPIEASSFPADDMFRPIFERVRETLKAEPLLPAHDGGFVSARHARLARGAALRELLSSEQLQALYQTQEPVQWLAGEITQERTYELHDYLQEELGIEEVTPEEFVRRLDIGFLHRQSDEWMVRFYGFLSGQEALWRAGGRYHGAGRLRNKSFIRLQDGKHVAPFRNGDSPNAYLPPAEETDFPIVKRAIAEDREALDFLKKLDLRKPDVVAEVLDRVLPKYDHVHDLDDIEEDEHARDVQKIIRALKTVSAGVKGDLVERLESTPFARAVRATGTGGWACPRDAYFRSPELELYFEGNPDAWFLDVRYDQWRQEFLEMGVREDVRISCRPADRRGHVVIAREWGLHKRGLDGFDPGTEIDGLAYALTQPSVEKAAYIWNALLLPTQKHIRGVVESSTKQTYEESEREEQLSPMGQAVCESEWLPDPSGSFCLPSHLSLDELPDGFIRDESLAGQLRMRPTSLGTLAGEAGVRAEIFEFVRDHQDAVEEFMERWLSEHQELPQPAEPEEVLELEDAEFNYTVAFETAFSRGAQVEQTDEYWEPEPVANTDRYRQRTAEDISASKTTERPREERFVKVPARRWEAKDNVVRPFLREQYGGRCQICDSTFLKRDGQPYFEGLYLVSRTNAGWIDRPGNVLCLCATCCAKFLHGSVLADDPRDQVAAFKVGGAGGNGKPALRIRLCGEDVEITYTERHMIDLQEMLNASQDYGSV